MEKNKEFQIEGYNYKFRIPYISPVDILAIRLQVNFESLAQTQTFFNFALEHIEVEITSGQWAPVKTPNKDVYMPIGVENDYMLLDLLIKYFLDNVLTPTFTKSNE